jgi:alpha-beta hydrolase superfamily lysophospholipase
MARFQRFRRLLIPLLAGLIFGFNSCSTRAFFYAPSKELTYHPDTIQQTVTDIYFRTGDSLLLHGWMMKPRSGKIIGTILHFHGNGGNISYHYAFIEPLVQAGFQCITWDYEGFGTSPGIPSQEHVLRDCLAALDYTRKREDVKGTKLILFGQSLGAFLALVTAAQDQQGLTAVVAEGAFTGHRDIAAYIGWHRFFAPSLLTRSLVRSKYDAKKVVDRITIPKLFIHSTEDRTCPFYMGQRLFKKAKAPKEFWVIKGKHICAALLYKDEFVNHFLKLLE